MKILNKKLNVVIIAGASGIGREIAAAYEREGASIFVCDISESFIKSFKNDFPNIFINKADVSIYKDVVSFFEKVRAEKVTRTALILIGPALEEEVLAFWDENAVFDRTLEQSSNRP